MSKISKLNIKEIAIPSDITKFFTLSSGYSFGISYGNEKGQFLYLFKIQNDNFIQIQKCPYIGYIPLIFYELKNKTLLNARRNSVASWKIKNDKIYRTTYINYDHNHESLAEILEAIEIENGKIILQNILGDIYILGKWENYKEKEFKNIRHDYIADDGDNNEYEFIYKIPYEKNIN